VQVCGEESLYVFAIADGKKMVFPVLITYFCKSMGFLNQKILTFREVTNAENIVEV